MADTNLTATDYLNAAERALAAGNVSAAEELRAAANAMQPPTQRLRALGQGAMLGFSDEAAAAAQHPISFAQSLIGGGDDGKAYEVSLKQERDLLKQYRKDYPYSSLGWELGGAVVPALMSGGATAELSAARGIPAVVNAAARGLVGGAKSGAAYGFGSGEGGALNRAASAGVGAVMGGIGGAVVGTGAGAVKEVAARKVVDWVRNKFGNRMAGPVAAEIQRMAEQGGLSADEIVAGVASGRIMAENSTLNNMIRRFYSEGGPAGAEIKRVMSARPAETRATAMEEMQGALASPGNPLANQRTSEELTKAAEDAAYRAAFGATPEVPQNVTDILTRVARDAPEALKNAAQAARLKYGLKPFFTEKDDGSIAFTRMPSLAEAESVYRSLRDLSGAAYKGGQGDIGEGYKLMRDVVKSELDTASPLLRAARSEAAGVRNARDAFVAGQQAVSKSPDELALIVKDIEALGPDATAAFREGLVTSIRAGMSKPGAAPGLMRNLANEGTGPGTALRLALPQPEVGRVIGAVETAQGAQTAAKHVLEGSATAQTMLAPRVGGAVNAAQEVAQGASGDLMAWARLIGGIADRLQPRLTDAQRLEVARIVVSKDPQLVLNALKDTSMIGKLQSATAKALDQVVKGGARGAAPAGLNLLITGEK